MCRALISFAFAISLLAGCVLYGGIDTPHGVHTEGSLAVQGSLTYTPRDADAGAGDAGAPEGFTVDLSDSSAMVRYDAASGELAFYGPSGWISVSLGSRPRVGTLSLSELNASVCVSSFDCQQASGSLDVQAYDLTCGTGYRVMCDETDDVCAGTIDVTFTFTPTSRGWLSGTVHLAGSMTLARDANGCAG